jgi:hypothetical protein
VCLVKFRNRKLKKKIRMCHNEFKMQFYDDVKKVRLISWKNTNKHYVRRENIFLRKKNAFRICIMWSAISNKKK